MSNQRISTNYNDHVKYINIAIDLAKESTTDVPIAALIVRNEQIIASATNQKERNNDPTAHAEILVLREASKILATWRLTDVTIYSTLEPCPMCASAILYSRIPVIVFAAYDSLYGAFGSVADLAKIFNFYTPQIIGGIEEEKASNLLTNFFRTSDVDISS